MRLILCSLIFLSGCTCSNPEAAEKAAQDFAKNIPKSTGSSCTQADTDGDGYCGCTVFVEDQPPVAIECGCEKYCVFNCARGCKVVETVKFKSN